MGVSDEVRVEVGSDVGDTWQIGMVGLRGSFGDSTEGGWVTDLEGGVGAGIGGRTCALTEHEEGEGGCKSDGKPRDERNAYGAYLGGGLSHHWEHLALYGRARGQLSRAENIPTTQWGSAVVGGQIQAGTHMRLYAGAGMAGYHNEDDSERGLILDAGLAVSTP